MTLAKCAVLIKVKKRLKITFNDSFTNTGQINKKRNASLNTRFVPYCCFDGQTCGVAPHIFNCKNVLGETQINPKRHSNLRQS